MGRHKGYKHSEATKMKIAKSLAKEHPATASIAAPQAGQEIHAASPDVDKFRAPLQGEPAAGPVVAAKDALDALALGPVKDVIALMLWKNRHAEPDLAMQITERDLSGFKACTEYLRVVPEVRIIRPQGRPGHQGMPATRTRSAIPPQEATPPKPYVIVGLVERGTENAIKAVENNEEDYALAEEAKNFRHARDVALRIASDLQREAATGNYSSSTINEAAQCLVALAR